MSEHLLEFFLVSARQDACKLINHLSALLNEKTAYSSRTHPFDMSPDERLIDRNICVGLLCTVWLFYRNTCS